MGMNVGGTAIEVGDQLDGAVRAAILAQPDAVLGDIEVMRALVDADVRAMGGNVVDLRGVAMDRLAQRLDRLEDTHRSVIAAAYDNLAGTALVHRAVLRLLETDTFEAFVAALEEVADILCVDGLRLVLEAEGDAGDALAEGLGAHLALATPGTVATEVGAGHRGAVLRRCNAGGSPAIWGDAGDELRSEACLLLDLGAARRPAMLVLGSVDPAQFAPAQGGDLLAFLGGTFERTLSRWLA